MIPFLINGIFLAAIVCLKKLGESSNTWADEQEQEGFQREREKWLDNRVLLDTFF
jgi:hypothetical protein